MLSTSSRLPGPRSPWQVVGQDFVHGTPRGPPSVQGHQSPNPQTHLHCTPVLRNSRALSVKECPLHRADLVLCCSVWGLVWGVILLPCVSGAYTPVQQTLPHVVPCDGLADHQRAITQSKPNPSSPPLSTIKCRGEHPPNFTAWQWMNAGPWALGRTGIRPLVCATGQTASWQSRLHARPLGPWRPACINLRSLLPPRNINVGRMATETHSPPAVPSRRGAVPRQRLVFK